MTRAAVPAAAVLPGAKVRRDVGGPLLTIVRVHNADPHPGEIRWETTDHGDMPVGGAALVEVVEF